MFESMTFDELQATLVNSIAGAKSAIRNNRLDLANKYLDEAADTADELPDSQREVDFN